MTPCLVLDLAALDKNLQKVSDSIRESRVSLRPHAKTHKSVRIARKQIEAGACGICVANIGEAEIFAANGISDILITSPMVADAKFERLTRLLASGARISVVVDCVGVARRLAAVADRTQQVIPVYLDVDMGRHRTGTSSESSAIEVATLLSEHSGFEFVGLQAYAGHLSHVPNFHAREEGASVAAKRIEEICLALRAHSIEIRDVSGGSTGTILIDRQIGAYSELQYGSYVFTDLEYDIVDLDGFGSSLFEPSLFVRTTVISNNWPGMATTDAGFKHFAGNGTLPKLARHDPRVARYEPRSDEHGAIYFTDGCGSYDVGTSIECRVPHCDPTVNLFNCYHVVEGNVLVDIWPVDARGAF